MWNKIKLCWKSRTVWAGGILAVLSAMQTNLINLAPALDEKTYGLVTFGLAIAIVILRFDTDKGLQNK